MRRLITCLATLAHLAERLRTALRYRRHLNYSWRLAWIKAER